MRKVGILFRGFFFQGSFVVYFLTVHLFWIFTGQLKNKSKFLARKFIFFIIKIIEIPIWIWFWFNSDSDPKMKFWYKMDRWSNICIPRSNYPIFETRSLTHDELSRSTPSHSLLVSTSLQDLRHNHNSEGRQCYS